MNAVTTAPSRRRGQPRDRSLLAAGALAVVGGASAAGAPSVALAQSSGGRTYRDDSLVGCLTDPTLMVPLGAAAVLYVVFRFARNRRQSYPGSDHDAEARAPRRRSGGGFGFGRKRRARRLLEQRRYVEAGDLLAEAGAVDEALDAYMQGGATDRAAPLLERQGDLRGAAQAYESAKEYETAARLWLRSGQPARAAHANENAQKYPEAARLWAVAGDHGRAGDALRKGGDPEGAAKALHRAERWEDAASIYLELAGSELGVGDTQHGPEQRRSFARTAGELLERAGNPQRALKAYRVAGSVDDAVRLLLQFGRKEKAARLLLKAGRTDEAIEAFEAAGEKQTALQLRAQRAREQGDTRRAAKLLAKAGELQAAAELLQSAGEQRAAAKLFARMKDWAAAATCYQAGGDLLRAAQAFERVQAWDAALDLYRELGAREEELRVLEHRKAYLALGRALLEDGDDERAEAALKKVGRKKSDYRSAALLLAGIYGRRRDHVAATIKYRQALTGKSPRVGRLDVFYAMADAAERAGEHDLAEQTFAAVLEADPTYKDCRARLETLRAPKKDPEPAARADSEVLNLVDVEPVAGRPSPATSPPTARPDRPRPPLRVVKKGGPLPQPAGAGRYELVELIGQGGMGEVFRARDLLLDREVAFKRMSTLPSDQRSETGNFLREARAVARLSHPNIVIVYDAGEEEGVPYITMELLSGESLLERLQRIGPLPLPELTSIIRQLCAGLAHAHDQGVIHRDLKPANLFRAQGGVLKIMDFGLARVLKGSKADTRSVLRGTPYYMSPEQIRSRPVDFRTDVYSLGVSLYELTCGRVPFSSPTGDVWPVFEQHLHAEPVPPRKLRRECPRWLERVVMWCLRKDPEYRPPNLPALWNATRSAAKAEGVAGLF